MRYQRWLKRGAWPEFLEAFLKTLDPLELDTWRDALERAALLRSVVRGRDFGQECNQLNATAFYRTGATLERLPRHVRAILNF